MDGETLTEAELDFLVKEASHWPPKSMVISLVREIQRHRAKESERELEAEVNREARRIADAISATANHQRIQLEVLTGSGEYGCYVRTNQLLAYRAALARLKEKAAPEGTTGSGLSFTALRGTPPPGAAPFSEEERRLLEAAKVWGAYIAAGGGVPSPGASTVEYAAYRAYLASLPKKPSAVDQAIGRVIMMQDAGMPTATEIVDAVLDVLRERGWKEPA